jgi:hypothetical protein
MGTLQDNPDFRQRAIRQLFYFGRSGVQSRRSILIRNPWWNRIIASSGKEASASASPPLEWPIKANVLDVDVLVKWAVFCLVPGTPEL